MNTTETTPVEEVAADAQNVAVEAQEVAEKEAAKEEQISLDEARKLRSEAKGLRERAKTAEAQLAKIDAEKLSETEKLQKQLEESTTRADVRESRLKTVLLNERMEQLRNEFGVRAPKSMARLIDADKLEFDLETGEVSGVEDELKRLRKEDPDLFTKGGTDGGRGGSGGGTNRADAPIDMNSLIRTRAGRG